MKTKPMNQGNPILTTAPDNRRVAIYCRVSTNMQHTGLEAQERALREYCTNRGITNYLVFQDENFSGTRASRPALDSMMAEVRKGTLSTVIVYSFSRFARSTTHLLSALEEFKKKNVAFVSTTEQIDTNSPLGTAFFTILACLAQLERDLIAERVKNGLANARAKGKKIGRAKTRPSELIRSLLRSGMTYRKAAAIARVSHGSIHAEKRAILLEEQEARKKLEMEQVQIATGATQSDSTSQEQPAPVQSTTPTTSTEPSGSLETFPAMNRQSQPISQS